MKYSAMFPSVSFCIERLLFSASLAVQGMWLVLANDLKHKWRKSLQGQKIKEQGEFSMYSLFSCSAYHRSSISRWRNHRLQRARTPESLIQGAYPGKMEASPVHVEDFFWSQWDFRVGLFLQHYLFWLNHLPSYLGVITIIFFIEKKVLHFKQFIVITENTGIFIIPCLSFCMLYAST